MHLNHNDRVTPPQPPSKSGEHTHTGKKFRHARTADPQGMVKQVAQLGRKREKGETCYFIG